MHDKKLLCLFVILSLVSCASASDIIVTNEAEFSSALSSAGDGDRILLAPGNYDGGFFQSNLTGVTIRSQFINNLATIVGGTNAIQLSDATRVTIEYLTLQGQTGNGLNIDDGLSREWRRARPKVGSSNPNRPRCICRPHRGRIGCDSCPCHG